MQKELNEKPLRAIVVAVQLPSVTDIELNETVNELRELAKTLGYQVVGTFIQKRTSFDRTAYVGIGKRQEMRSFVEGEIDNDDALDVEPMPASPRKAANSGATRAKEAAQSAARMAHLQYLKT